MNIELESILLIHGQPDFDTKISRLLKEHSMRAFLEDKQELAASVRHIVADVGKRGDAAVSEYSERFDRVRLSPEEFRISAEELKKAHSRLEPALLQSLRKAIENVRLYQSQIFIGGRTSHPGIRYLPLQRVGLCIPGASAPLPSTLIMTAVPAQTAGVQEIVVVSPPRWQASIHPVILGLCYELNITEVYRLGGAHAVAALAFGTQTIPKVDKIVGPGHDVVQLAKKEVYGMVDIDSFAGPSDVLIIADSQAEPEWVAADILSQAEHNPGAGILATDSLPFARNVLAELEKQLSQLNRAEGAARCLLEYSGILVFQSLDAAVDWANEFAAEHVQVQCGPQSRKIADRLRNAGAVFIGPYSPVAVGDYWAGPSHTLPTRQTSRYFSALTSNDFIKSISIIEYSEEQLRRSAENIIRLALTEGLDAHAASIQKRLR
ncbi:MAG TPA: histidinol dehydrogenase [Anaerohalosphaeraceae bacterium]|nr:histidinol dehydrogenase [Anaerohalosphaeraceae bacterium]HQG05466.1 histidinol dehydrogenase [Anaerohalosphaeraceae bacterium]HQI06839.1 histidinol dehydrogenase [Anaerohalosphaeraceae bacterium]HQJ67260.1 histidinol dehydrogenase [Anaerohalosphaeraceae bacterium]